MLKDTAADMGVGVDDSGLQDEAKRVIGLRSDQADHLRAPSIESCFDAVIDQRSHSGRECGVTGVHHAVKACSDLILDCLCQEGISNQKLR